MATKCYAAGAAPEQFKPGSLLVTHGEHSFVDGCIRFGQRLRMRGADKKYAWFNHVACVVSKNGNIVEMLAQGAELNNASKYLSRDYAIIDLELEGPETAINVWLDLVDTHVHYGWVSIISVALTMLSGSWLQFGKRDTIICSGAAVLGLIAEGASIPLEWRMSPAFVTPAEVAKWGGAVRGDDLSHIEATVDI